MDLIFNFMPLLCNTGSAVFFSLLFYCEYRTNVMMFIIRFTTKLLLGIASLAVPLLIFGRQKRKKQNICMSALL